MQNVLKIVSDGGTAAYLIVTMGLIALAVIIERVRKLYFEYAIKSDQFMEQIKSLVLADKVDEAITFCSANSKAPLAHVIKGVLERADREDESIHQGMDIALAEIIPNLGRRLGYLSMLANVATLMGLLGTITGLIMAFSAVSYADPSQKQVVLAQGISMAMNTTALGLSVAIPIMVAYAFLHARQNQLLEVVTENAAKVVDWLTTRHYVPFDQQTVYPNTDNKEELAKRANGQSHLKVVS